MGLVDRDERTVHLAEERAEPGEHEPLGRDVDERHLAPGDQRHAPAHLRCVERGSEIGRADSARLERLDLIGHERHQRRYDQGSPLQDRRRELVAQALAAARRRHEQEPAPREQRFHRLALARTKLRVAQPRESHVDVAHASPVTPLDITEALLTNNASTKCVIRRRATMRRVPATRRRAPRRVSAVTGDGEGRGHHESARFQEDDVIRAISGRRRRAR